MKELIVLKHILEGLIHNLNNPLNLIMGYSQRLKQSYPESTDAQKIYEAGIQIDDMLKQLSQKLWDNSFHQPVSLRLGFWLQGELTYLKHYLPLKHGLVITRQDTTEDTVVMTSPYQLSWWYESVLLKLLEFASNQKIQSGICEYQNQPALYLTMEKDLPTDASFTALLDNLASLNPAIQSIWEPDTNTIYGVIYEN